MATDIIARGLAVSNSGGGGGSTSVDIQDGVGIEFTGSDPIIINNGGITNVQTGNDSDDNGTIRVTYGKDSKTKSVPVKGLDNAAYKNVDTVIDESTKDSENLPTTKAVKEVLDSKIDSSKLGEANGIATLDEHKKLVSDQLPSHNHGSNEVNVMTNYQKPSTLTEKEIKETDSLNTAIGKLEKAIDDKMDDGNYAGSSTKGGSATSAEKLSNTEQIGTNKKPVYFSADGVPVAIDHAINSDVPENAKFTDTKYSAGTGIRVTDDTIYNMGVLSMSESTINGCIDITVGKNGTETSESKTIPVHGLGDAAYKNVDTVITKDSASLITSGAVSTELDKKMNSSMRNSANGVAGLDGNSKISVSQIPTTDEYNAESAYPVTGKAIEAAIGTLDVTGESSIGAGKTISSWSETDGKVSITTQNISITKSQISDFPSSMTPTSHNQASSTINAMTGYSKPTETSAITSSDTLNSAIGKLEKAMDGKSSTSHTHSSYVNQNAFSNVKVGDVTVAADSTTDTLTLASGTNVTITPDASTDTITISAKDTTYSAATTSVSGLMSADDKTKLDGIATGANKYTLPSASSSTLGGVKVGSNITVSSGTISLTKSNVTSALGYTPINSTLKGANNGIAELDENGKVLTSQLPSYVDDVIEATALSSFPSAGEAGKIYVDTSTNKTYRWSGSGYTEISASLALGETSSTAYRGDRGKVAYDHSQAAHARTDATKTAASSTNGNILINGTEITVYKHPAGTNPHGTTKSDVGLGNVPNVATNDQTPSYTEASSLAKLTSGEKLSVAFGKISKAVTDLISHLADSVKHITSTERTNWNAAKTHADSAHAPSSAQANVIETVKVNGTALTPSSKAVNITVPVTTDTYSSTGTAPVNGKAVASAIGALDVAAVSVGTTETIKSISETDGKIAVTKQSIAIKSNQVNGMTSYSKATSSSAITTSDSLNTAVGKLEYKADNNETNISNANTQIADIFNRCVGGKNLCPVASAKVESESGGYAIGDNTTKQKIDIKAGRIIVSWSGTATVGRSEINFFAGGKKVTAVTITNATSVAFEVELDSDVDGMHLYCSKACVFSNMMIRYADVKDDTYVPYIPTNAELQEQINALTARCEALEPAATSTTSGTE